MISCVGGEAWLIFNADGDGEIEPGSSGSPIFDAAKRVRGTDSCATWDCNTDDIAEYGRFDLAWPLLQPYLHPTDPIYVNGSWSGTEHGTLAEPFNTVLEGVFAVIAGSNIHIEAGSYDEQFTITKPMTLNARSGVVIIGE